MIVVRLKLNWKANINEDYWKDRAKGSKDSYGNPFRIIKLIWNNDGLHPMTDYVKTHGFEDAVIGVDRKTGNFKITYRKNGTAMWRRPVSNVGPYMAEVALTSFNLKKLARSYGDKLWTIADADIDAKAKAMYERDYAKMSEEDKKFNKMRIAAMKTHRIGFDVRANQSPISDKVAFENEKVEFEKRKQEFEKELAEFNKEKSEVAKEEIVNIEKGIDPIKYDYSYLNKCDLPQLRTIAKEVGVEDIISKTKAKLKQAIQDKQNGVKTEETNTEDGATDDDLSGLDQHTPEDIQQETPPSPGDYAPENDDEDRLDA